MKANLTVEASLVFPFCFLIIGIVCFLGIFIYDQSVLKITGYECILQSMDQIETDDAYFLERLQKQAEEVAQHRTLAVAELQTNVKSSAAKITVNYRGRQKMLNLPIDITIVYEKTFPELTLRLTRKK